MDLGVHLMQQWKANLPRKGHGPLGLLGGLLQCMLELAWLPTRRTLPPTASWGYQGLLCLVSMGAA